MSRTLQDWAHLAEIVGGVAIILSLLFVGFQVSENSRQVRSETAHNVTAAMQSWYLEMGANAQAASTFRKAVNDPINLSEDEAVQFVMSAHSIMLVHQSMYFLGAEGTLDAEMNRAMSSSLAAVARTKGFAWYWEQRRVYFTDEFQGFVDDVIAGTAGDGAHIYQ